MAGLPRVKPYSAAAAVCQRLETIAEIRPVSHDPFVFEYVRRFHVSVNKRVFIDDILAQFVE